MARYQCGICGYIFDEDAEEKEFSDLEKCPVCGASMDKFRLVEDSGGQEVLSQDSQRMEASSALSHIEIIGSEEDLVELSKLASEGAKFTLTTTR